MTEKAQHKDRGDQKGFAKGKKEAPRKGAPKPADTSKSREAKRAKGGRRERETS